MTGDVEADESSQEPTRSGDLAALARADLLVLGGILLITVLAFMPALQAELLDWDDNLTVTENPRLDDDWSEFSSWAFSTFFMGHYQPLSWLSLKLDTALFGRGPVGYHLTNLVLHLLNVVLVWALCRHFAHLVLRRLGVSAVSWTQRLSIALAALLFAAHPLRVESVVWVTERRDVLSALFFFGSFWLYSLASSRREMAQTAAFDLKASVLLILSWLCFVSSLLSKASGVVLVALIVLADLAVYRRLRPPWLRRSNLVVVAEKIPFLAVAAAAAWIAPRAQAATNALVSYDVLGLGERLLLMAHGWVYYVRKSLWPSPLSHLYELPLEIDLVSWRFGGSVALLIVLAVLSVIALRRLGAHPWMIGLALVACAYTLLLLPVLGLFQSGPQLVADRYSYLPSAFVALGLAAGTVVLPRELGRRLLLGGLPVAVGLAIQTFVYASTWTTNVSLWENSIAADPTCAYCLEGAATSRLESGQRASALAAFERALELRPNLFKANTQVAMLLEGDDPDRAREHYFRAHRLRPDLPILLERGAALSARVGDTTTARAAYERLLSWQPGSPELWERAIEVELAAEDCPRALALIDRARQLSIVLRVDRLLEYSACTELGAPGSDQENPGPEARGQLEE